MTEQLHAIVMWLYAAMISWVPIEQQTIAHQEPPAAVQARYEAMAQVFAEVAYDPAEEPLFRGKTARAQTAEQLAAIASFESYFRKDVETGEKLGDHGTAYCVMQVHPEDGVFLRGSYYGYAKQRDAAWRRANAESIFTGADLTQDDAKCVRVALHMIRESMEICRRQRRMLQDQLGIYTGEGCSGSLPNEASRKRIKRATEYFRSNPPPDGEVAER